MNAFAQKIRELRMHLKLSEKQLSQKCGLAESYIVQIESGKKVINEESAEKIMAALGAKSDFGFEQESASTPVAPLLKVKPLVESKKTAPSKIDTLDPINQWADALSGIIRPYPIYALETNQIVGKKELAVIGKKVEGYALDKIRFVQITQNDMAAYRLLRGDIVLVELTKDQPQQGLYLIEINQSKMIRFIKREPGNKYTLSKGIKDEIQQTIETKNVTIIGLCVRSEVRLSQL